MTNQVEMQRERIVAAKQAGTRATLREYLKLSGPGWLQSAITLGGGSLAGSLYLGIIGGYELMWLQPLMMVFGVVMLSAIAQVSLVSQERPFAALNAHVSPVLGWGWIIATLMANLVWAMPQFSLGSAALQQNLGMFNFRGGDYVAATLLLGVSVIVVWLYAQGGIAFRLFDVLLKVMVGVIVASFFLVVFLLSTSGEGLPWARILAGFIPNPMLIFEPTESLQTLISQSSSPEYWREAIVSAQRDRMVAAAATAVGINMTFLLPYSMLKRGWDREFTGLVKFDLSTGLFVPFMLATSCVVIAAATQFHARPEPGLVEFYGTSANSNAESELPEKLVAAYTSNLEAMLEATGSARPMAEIPAADRVLAATLVQRDAFELANSLERLAGAGRSQVVFGVGVVGMAVSSIIILMLINGFAICEIFGQPSSGWLYRFGCLLPGLSGAFGALYLWSGKANFYLAVPTSRFGMVLLPIAYIAFFCLMNNSRLLGADQPRGAARWIWNGLMAIAVGLAVIGAAISILNDKAQLPGSTLLVRHVAIGLVALMLVVAVVIHFLRPRTSEKNVS